MFGLQPQSPTDQVRGEETGHWDRGRRL